MKKRMYKLVGGPHVTKVDGETVTYQRGDVLESHEDLNKKFPNKFEEVTVKSAPKLTPVEKRKVKKEKPPEEDEDLDEEEIVESEEEIEEDNEDEEEPEPEEDEEGFGDDVSGSFKRAKSADLKVFFNKKAKLYTVVDNDEPTVPLNAEELKTKDQVRKFLETYLKPGK